MSFFYVYAYLIGDINIPHYEFYVWPETVI